MSERLEDVEGRFGPRRKSGGGGLKGLLLFENAEGPTCNEGSVSEPLRWD